MLAAQGAKTNQLAENTAELSTSTNKIVKSQTDILNAIKQVTDDTKLTAQQQTNIIICMLQVPVTERTTDLQSQCRSQAATQTVATDTAGTSSSTAPKTSNSSAAASGSSPQSTPSTAPPQSNNPQPSLFSRIVNKVKGIL